MRRVLMLRGLPGAGKSFWARQYLAQHPEAVRVNRDCLRDMLHNGRRWSPEDEQMTARARETLICQMLLMGRTVIIDDTNLLPHHLKQLRALVEPLGGEIEVIDMPTSLEECIARDARREHPVGERRIREMADEATAAWAKIET